MRIISLCPSLTETVFALGAGQHLAGITDYCIHPAAEVGRIPKMGGTKTPNIAAIIQTAPDLILMNREENRREDAQSLTAAGLTCLVTDPKAPADAAKMVRAIGQAIDRKAAASAIAADIETACQSARKMAITSLSFACLIWRKPWMSVNADTYIHGMFALCGAVNVFADMPERYPEINVASLKDSRPDYIFLSTEPFPFKEKHIAELAALTDFPPDRFHILDGEYLSWHGARTAQAIRYLSQLLATLARAQSKFREGTG